MNLFLFFLIQVFRPDAPIVMARDTTFIVSPVGADSLPDYRAYLRELSRKDATPDNNAAVLVWQAMWPRNLDPEDFEPMQAELGLKELPLSKDALQPIDGDAIRKRIADWLQLNPEDFELNEYVLPPVDHAWSSKQHPPLAEWVAANKRPLDLLVDASRRTRYYSPSPSLLNRKPDLLTTILLPGAQNLRGATRALGIRSMQHVGENRLNEAWTDVLAIHRLSRLSSQGPTVVDQLIAIAMSDTACRDTLAITSSEHLPVALATRIKNDIENLPLDCHIGECFDKYERVSSLDAVLYMKQHGILYGLEALENPPASEPNFTRFVSFDSNIVMRRMNKWYDRLVVIAKLPPGPRKEAYNLLFAELEIERERILHPARLAAAALSRSSRSELISRVLANLMLPGLDVANAAVDRAATTLELTRLGAAIAIYRAKHGNYPATLDSLVPEIVKSLPVDLYNKKPFIYKRTDDGYLLYSAGENGQDDGGSNERMQLLEGQSEDEVGESELEQFETQISEADDVCIRVPRPPFKLPLIKQLDSGT